MLSDALSLFLLAVAFLNAFLFFSRHHGSLDYTENFKQITSS